MCTQRQQMLALFLYCLMSFMAFTICISFCLWIARIFHMRNQLSITAAFLLSSQLCAFKKFLFCFNCICLPSCLCFILECKIPSPALSTGTAADTLLNYVLRLQININSQREHLKCVPSSQAAIDKPLVRLVKNRSRTLVNNRNEKGRPHGFCRHEKLLRTKYECLNVNVSYLDKRNTSLRGT